MLTLGPDNPWLLNKTNSNVIPPLCKLILIFIFIIFIISLYYSLYLYHSSYIHLLPPPLLQSIYKTAPPHLFISTLYIHTLGKAIKSYKYETGRMREWGCVIGIKVDHVDCQGCVTNLHGADNGVGEKGFFGIRRFFYSGWPATL